MRSCALVLALAVVACKSSGRDSSTVADSALARSMTGAWDANLSLTRPYPLGAGSPAVGRICGTIGFVENRHSNDSGRDSAESFGVYDLDLRRFGLNWLDDDSFPEALASAPHPTASRSLVRAPDSVTIVLNPGSRERIVLAGEHNTNGIDGEWMAQSARGTAAGYFSLRPHDGSRPSC